ncbi:MAG TPA: fibronectin type III domain-containing protein, partial [Thermoanaerobaculia bacterium]
DGSVSTPRVILTAPNAMQIPLEVMYTGSGYVVAYGRHTNTDIKTGVIRLGASGEPVGTPEPPSLPAVYPADAASNGETLLIAFQPRTLPLRNSTIAVNAAGEARAPEVVAFNYSRQTQPVLASGGGDAVAGWTEIAGDHATVRVAHVDAEGNATAVYNIANGYFAEDGLAWSGTQYLAVFRSGSSLLAMRIAAHGAPIDVNPIVLVNTLTTEGKEVPASVIWAGDRWLIIWGDGPTLHRASVSAAGIASTPRTLTLHAPAREGWERSFLTPSLAFDGEHVLLGSTVADLPPCMMPPCEGPEVEVMAALLASNGSLITSLELDVEEQVRTSVASSGTNFLLLAGTRAFVLDARGTRLRVVIDRTLFDWPAESDVTWDGTNYVVALRYAGSNWYLAVRRLNRAANDVAAARGTQTLAPIVAAQPSIVPLFAGDALIGVQEGTAEDGMRAVVYRERDFTPLPAPPAPPQNVHLRRVNGYTFELTWEPPASGAEAYVVEHLIDGQWYLVARLDADDARRVTVYATDPAEVRVRAFNAGGPSAPAGPGALVRERRRSVR